MTAHLSKITVSEMQAELRDQAERFCAEKSPISRVRTLLDDELGYDADVWLEMADLGWLGIAIDENYDGLGLDMADVVPIAEAMGRHLMNSPFISTTLVAQALQAGGSEVQKSDWLPKLASGTVATIALFEREGSWDLSETSGAAKTFALDIEAAEIVLISVRHKDKTRLALIEPGRLSARREVIIDETRRSYTFDVPEVSEDDLLPPETTTAALDRIELVANLLQAAELSGAAQACVDYTVDYLKTRKQFGKLIGAYQALKHPAVDTFVEAEKARSLAYAAATHFEKQGDGEIAVRMAAVQAQKALSFAADRSIQFHGGFGFTYDCDAQLYRRRAMFAASQYGDPAYHRAKLAELLL